MADVKFRILICAAVILAALILTTVLFAQETAPLTGTVTLRGGQTLSGVIRIAELGVVPGSGIGTLLAGGGAFTLRVGGEQRSVPAADLAVMEATWVNEGSEVDPRWKIQQVKLTTKAGDTIVGQPSWLIHASEVSIEGQPAVHAFPLAGTDFSADNFITKITLGEAAPAPAPTTPPAEPTPPPAEPTAPAVTPPAEVPPPVEVTLPPPLVPQALEENEMTFTVACPECGKKIRITIKASAVAEQ